MGMLLLLTGVGVLGKRLVGIIKAWDLDVLCHHNNFISWVIGHFFDQLLLMVVVMQVVDRHCHHCCWHHQCPTGQQVRGGGGAGAALVGVRH